MLLVAALHEQLIKHLWVDVEMPFASAIAVIITLKRCQFKDVGKCKKKSVS